MKRRIAISYTQKIAFIFLAIILTGAFLLTLPISTKSGMPTPFIDALFTASTSTCVTGLVVTDTVTHWSMFGQIVILLLIQTGGLGFMTMATLFSLAIGRRIGLKERVLMGESLSLDYIGGIVRMTRHILFGTFFFEGIGAIILIGCFYKDFGTDAIFMGIFHSVSAFCNAGLDLMGSFGQYSSLMHYVENPVVNITVMVLITLGGLGFIVWENIYIHRLHFHKYSLHTKIVLVTSAFLIVIPAALFFIIERTNPQTLGALSLHGSILASFFQSVTMRTAGYNTINIASMHDASILIIICGMLIGGSPGSAAGGIKTTSFAVILLAVRAVVKKQHDVSAFGRRIDQSDILKAFTILIIALFFLIISVCIICTADNVGMKEALFEVTSAMATVGLSLGITPTLSVVSKLVLIFMMYFGRIGIFTIVVVFAIEKKEEPLRYVSEKVFIG